MAKTNKQKEYEIAKRRAALELVFNEYLGKLKGNSAILKNQSRKGWQKLSVSSRGAVNIRCQAKLKSGSQCAKIALRGMLLCSTHGGKGLVKREEIKKMKRDLGIYSGSDIKSLQKELREVKDLTEEQLQDSTDELKLGIALLRKYLRETEDIKIAKNPGQLMWLIGEIARLKKEHYEVKHSKDVSFTKDQVEFLFNQFYLILIDEIKDVDLLKTIADRLTEIGKQIGRNGFKVVS